jgi:hypothetical protein
VVVIVGLEGIMDNCCSFSGGFSGGDSLFEWPNERSLKREAIFSSFFFFSREGERETLHIQTTTIIAYTIKKKKSKKWKRHLFVWFFLF